MIGTKDHPPPHQRAYHPVRQLRLGSGKKWEGIEERKRKEETYIQDLREVSG